MQRHAILFAATLLALAACGGGNDSEPGVASLSDAASSVVEEGASDELDQEAAVIALTECLRDEGLDISDPTVDADGNVRIGEFGDFDSSQRGPDSPLGRAFAACQEHLEGLTRGFRGAQDTELQDTLLEFAACMRENGVDMPDPDFSNFGPPDDGEREPGEGGPFGGFDLDDPTFQAAQAACEDILAGFGPGGGLGRGPAGGGDG